MENQEAKNEALIGGSELNAGLERFTHDDLRKWGQALDKEKPRSLGERLLCFADDWRESLTMTEEKATAITLSILDPWLNGDPCEGCNCNRVCRRLQERIINMLMRSNVKLSGSPNTKLKTER